VVDLDRLRAPFAPEEHQWRAQSVARDGRRAQALCYINARAVQARLDDVCGVAGWQSEFAETPSGRVIATIKIEFGDRWISKSDGAGATAMEGEKGGLSDAFKRAAVMWGIGRYLYAMPATWAECEVLRDDKGPRLRNGKPVWKNWTSRGARELQDAVCALIEGLSPAPRALTDQRAVLLPAPEVLAPAVEAEPAPWPIEVTTLLQGLPAAIRDGSNIEFWGQNFRQVPREWRPFVIAERDRIKREMRR